MMERVPSDILGLIFLYYCAEMGIPERLLRVCKAWRMAAFGRRSLWSRITINIDNVDSIGHCIHHARSRLELSGPTIHLNITIRATFIPDLVHDHHYDGEAVYSAACEVLDILAGARGEHRARWSSLIFCPSANLFYGGDEDSWIKHLSGHFPLLQHVELQNVRVLGEHHILSSSPALVSAIFINAIFRSDDMDIVKVQMLILENCSPLLPSLRTCRHLRELHIRNIDQITFWEIVPTPFFSIVKLVLCDVCFSLAAHLTLPRLRELFLEMTELTYFEDLLDNEGEFPFHQLHAIGLAWCGPLVDSGMSEALDSMLQQSSSLHTLFLNKPWMICLLMMMYENAEEAGDADYFICDHNFHVFQVADGLSWSILSDRHITICGPLTWEDVENLSQSLGLAEDVSL
jgi:hypothetical protein